MHIINSLYRILTRSKCYGREQDVKEGVMYAHKVPDGVKWMLRPDSWIRRHLEKLIERAEGISDKKIIKRRPLGSETTDTKALRLGHECSTVYDKSHCPVLLWQ